MSAPNDESPALVAALRYAAAGLHVVACHTVTQDGCSCLATACASPGKHPRYSSGTLEHGWKDATRDETIIRRWWACWPRSNVAIATGPSGLVVLDPDADGLAAWEDLCRAYSIPETLSARTGGGGKHVYFRAPSDRELGNSPGRLPAGIDVRGAGGYVIAPPSVHATGARYQWIDPRAPIQTLPAILVRLLRPAPWAARPPAAAASGTIHQHERNCTLTSLGGIMRRGGMTALEIEAALLAVNRDRCQPPLDEREVSRIAHSVARYAPAPRPRYRMREAKRA